MDFLTRRPAPTSAAFRRSDCGRDRLPLCQGGQIPDVLNAGLRVERLGTSSVIYQIALFQEHDEEPCAVGGSHIVYVDRTAALRQFRR
jgi:hypothetical protein